ncbi:MarR family winged helix-turn-helix transcriptional regulator [Cohnella sp. JJ-181]|uniref:MarR family winged helix-turn-helix transcriptional regulator n=1 Tax=Cohnella rhizoplanae TaxID=2974897 RepID=UPI0022FF79E4|nr:MarR family transcriptional regulator [Cohnella sp. JJ-181]CAI6024900.1 putative HTH-type transcriptional regulator YusO [Cohnella sp. JJ-181]
MGDQSLISELFNSFREVNQSFYQSMQRAGQHLGVTPIQLLVMKSLRGKPQMSLSELAECLFVGPSTASGIVERMVKAKLVSRERPENDRRSIALRLTPEGEALWVKIDERRKMMLEPLNELGEEDISDLLRIHGRIVQILHRAREENKDE